jgi:4-amino-4-deoxy-L-arabinose transferase-like glycosyltransferase
VLAFALTLRVSAFEANAADQYGYVSQAMLWARGHLIRYEPLAAIAPWREPARAFAPLGYTPGPKPATVVPAYPPGLPLVMAGFVKLAGPIGAFLAVPLLGALALFLTFLLGRRFGGGACGLLAIALLFTSPIFLFQLKEPMSDVPVTAWWLLAIVLCLVNRPSAGVAAGLASSAAIMTRPNLLPVAAILAAFVFWYAPARLTTRLRHVLSFAAGIVPGCLAVAALNTILYGSALQSGYGSMSALFDTAYVRANLLRYPRWLLTTETPVICAALATPWLFHGLAEAADDGADADVAFIGSRAHRRDATRLVPLFAVVTLVVWLCYLFYLPFENWSFLRFLLPTIPLLLVATSAVGVIAISRMTAPSSKLIVAALIAAVLAWRWDTAVDRGFHPIQPHERRFAVIGEFARDRLPANAAVFTIIHSGSLRYYSSRLTVRWDWLGPDDLDTALNFFRAHGYHPYFLIEDWERSQFVGHFGGRSAVGSLDWRPFATYSGGTNAAFFDPDDRQHASTRPVMEIK